MPTDVPNTDTPIGSSDPSSRDEQDQTHSGDDEFLNQSPSIELPKGGGAINGMGETFVANSATGTGTLSVPLALSPGRGGFTPQLTLSYDTANGNGPVGFG